MDGTFLPAGGDVPASLPALRWTPKALIDSTPPDPTVVQMVRITNDGEEPVAIKSEADATGGYIIKFDEPLKPHSDYVVRGESACNAEETQPGAKEFAFHAADAVPLPTSLGALTAETPSIEEFDVWTSSGSCYAPIKAAVSKLTLGLSAEAQPWERALIIDVVVDGAEWQRSTSSVFARCSSADEAADKGLTEGTHSVVMRATLPGTDLVLETAPVSVTLSCATTGGPDDKDPATKDGADLPPMSCAAAAGLRPTPSGGFGAASVGVLGALLYWARSRRRSGAAPAGRSRS